MLKTPLLVIPFSLCLSAFGQLDMDSVAQKNIILKDSSFIAKQKNITLLETDSFIVITPYSVFLMNLKSFIEEHEIDEDKELLMHFTKNNSDNSSILAGISNNKKLLERLKFRIIDLIKRRKCIVYNKTTKALERTIIFTEYWKHWWIGEKYSTLKGELIIDIKTGAI